MFGLFGASPGAWAVPGQAGWGRPMLSADLPRAHRAPAVLGAGAGIDHRLPHMVFRAPPPDFLVAARRDHLGGEAAVEGRVPFRRHHGVPGGQVVEPRQDLAAGAVGAVAALGPGTDGSPPAVPQPAPPPGHAVAVGGDLPGGEGPVSLRVPLPGQGGEEGGQVVLPRHHLLAGAHRAAGPTLGPGDNGRLPHVAFGALPPDLPPAAGHHVLGGEGPVLRGVPFPDQVGVLGGQVVVPGVNLPAGAVGAAGPFRPGLDDGAPLVALGALPPHPAVAAAQDLVRGEVPVPRGVPLLGQVRELGSQIIEPWPGPFAGAVGAAALRPGSGVHRRLPPVALLTDPPDLLAAAVGEARRGQRGVAHLVPLAQHRLPLGAGTVVRQAFSHCSPPSFFGPSPGLPQNFGFVVPTGSRAGTPRQRVPNFPIFKEKSARKEAGENFGVSPAYFRAFFHFFS